MITKTKEKLYIPIITIIIAFTFPVKFERQPSVRTERVMSFFNRFASQERK